MLIMEDASFENSLSKCQRKRFAAERVTSSRKGWLFRIECGLLLPLMERQSVTVADLLGDSTGALAGDVNQFVVRGELVKCWQQCLRLGKEFVSYVALHASHHVVHAKMIVTHGTHHVAQIEFLPLQAIKNSEELVGRTVQRVVECHLEFLGSFFIAE